MESFRGIINSYLSREEMEVSFLQMLSGTTTPYQEVDIVQEDKQQLEEHILQHLQQEYNLSAHLKMQECYNNTMRSSSTAVNEQLDSCITLKDTNTVNVCPTKARKKRKRTRAPQPTTAKNPEEMESQRMNHIAVERNRRKLVNSHLNALRSIMPSSFVQRNDQASIVAGAIDFIKELEQHLQFLKAKKRHRANEENMASSTTSSSTTSNEEDIQVTARTMADFLIAPQYMSYTENKCGVDVEATVVQGHVNLKIVGRRNRGQIVRAVSALEQIGLTVMHLNITTLDASSILYSLNLKVEEESKMRSADEIASVVHQIFSYIISTCCE